MSISTHLTLSTTLSSQLDTHDSSLITQQNDLPSQESSFSFVLPRDLLYEIADFLLDNQSFDYFNQYFKELARVDHKKGTLTDNTLQTQPLLALQNLLINYFSSNQSRLPKLAAICAYNLTILPLAYAKVLDYSSCALTSYRIISDRSEDTLDTLCTQFQNLQLVDFLTDSLPHDLTPLLKLKRLQRINSSFCKTISPIIPHFQNPLFATKEWRFFLCNIDEETREALKKYAETAKKTTTIVEGVFFITPDKLETDALLKEMTAFLLSDESHVNNLLKSCSYNIEQLPIEWKNALQQVAPKAHHISLSFDTSTIETEANLNALNKDNLNSLLLYFHNLNSLSFNSCTLDESHFEILLTQKERFCTLVFQNCTILTKEPFSCLDKFANLTKLTIAFIETQLSDAILTPIAKLKHLEELDLSGIKSLTDKGIEKLQTLVLLRTLDLSSCLMLTPACLQTLARLPSLTSLNLSNCQNFKNKRIAVLLQLLSLRTLKLNRFDFYHLDDLQNVARMTWLRNIEFGTIVKPFTTEMKKLIASMDFLETLAFRTAKLKENELAAMKKALPNTTLIYQNKTYKEVAESKKNL
jgi:hypothetical protein